MTFINSVKTYGNFYVPRYQILIGKKDVLKDLKMEVLNLSFEEAIDEFQRFSFSVNFPRSKWVDEKLFEPGEVVEVKMGYANNTKLMMVGEMVAVELQLSRKRYSTTRDWRV